MRVFFFLFFFSFKLVLTSGLTLFLLHRTGSKLLFGSCSEFFVSDISCFQLEGLTSPFFLLISVLPPSLVSLLLNTCSNADGCYFLP